MLIKVKAFPCSKEEKVLKISEDSFEVYVREKPVQGMANKAIISALSSFMNIGEGEIRMIKGFKERNKIFEIKEQVLQK